MLPRWILSAGNLIFWNTLKYVYVSLTELARFQTCTSLSEKSKSFRLCDEYSHTLKHYIAFDSVTFLPPSVVLVKKPPLHKSQFLSKVFFCGDDFEFKTRCHHFPLQTRIRVQLKFKFTLKICNNYTKSQVALQKQYIPNLGSFHLDKNQHLTENLP